MKQKLFAVAFALALVLTLVPRASAVIEDKRAIQFSVTGPVEIPGVVLTAGTYELKLADFGSSVAGIWSADGKEFYGYFQTVPASLKHTAGKAKVVLEGSGRTSPKRIEEWTYPGYRQAREFVYPKPQTLQVGGDRSNHRGL